MLSDMGLRAYLKKREERKLGEDRYILCLDGGGMRGIVSATILEHFEKMLRESGDDRPLYSHFDLVAGTSTGGLLALALTFADHPHSLLWKHEAPIAPKPSYDSPSHMKSIAASGPTIRTIVDIYIKYGKIIFPKSSSFLQLQVINQLFTEKYDDISFNHLLQEIFANVPMGEALTPTMVVTYDTHQEKPYIISSYHTPHLLMRTAARATSAAPTYFSSVPIRDGNSGTYMNLIDGGVCANNPVLYAYREAKHLYPQAKRFHVLSISTGNSARKTELERVGNGVIGWFDPMKGTPLYQMFTSSQMTTSSDIASSIDDLEYVRIQGELGRKISLDDTDPASLSYMVKCGRRIFSEHTEVLKGFCEQFMQRTSHPCRPMHHTGEIIT